VLSTASSFTFYDSMAMLIRVTDDEWALAGLSSSAARVYYMVAYAVYSLASSWTMVWTLTYCLTFLAVRFPPGGSWRMQRLLDLACVLLLALIGTVSFAINRLGERQAHARPWLCIVINVATGVTQLAVGLYVSSVRGARSPLAAVRNQVDLPTTSSSPGRSADQEPI